MFYTHILLVLCANKELFLINSDDPNNRKALKLKTNDTLSIKLYNQEKFELITEEKVYHFRSSTAEEWIKAIESA